MKCSSTKSQPDEIPSVSSKINTNSQMKNCITLLLLCCSIASFSQSNSFETLRKKFEGNEIATINVGGFVLRTVLWVAGENDWRDEFGDVKGVRLITIPQHSFKSQNLKISGFKKLLSKDNFEEMASIHNGNENVTVYMQDHHKNNNLYFILIENKDQVTAVELKGNIDPQKIIQNHYNKKLTTL